MGSVHLKLSLPSRTRTYSLVEHRRSARHHHSCTLLVRWPIYPQREGGCCRSRAAANRIRVFHADEHHDPPMVIPQSHWQRNKQRVEETKHFTAVRTSCPV